MMRILLFILIPFLLFAQNDWSSTAINYPNSFDDTTSIAQIDSNDFVPGSFYNKVMRIGRMLQEKVGVGVDTPKTAREVLMVVAEDSTEWRALVDADIPNTITLTNLSQVSDAEEAVEDYTGGMFTGNTETGIAVTYQDGDGTVDFVVSVVDSSFFRMETDTLASKNGGTTVLEDTLLISAMSADSLQLNGEWIIKMEKIGTHFAIILTGADTMWAASDTTGF